MLFEKENRKKGLKLNHLIEWMLFFSVWVTDGYKLWSKENIGKVLWGDDKEKRAPEPSPLTTAEGRRKDSYFTI